MTARQLSVVLALAWVAVAAPSSFAGDAPAVVVYGAEWCGPCHAAKDWLRSKGVAFTYRAIDTEPGAHEAYEADGGTGAIPFIVIGDAKIVGFDRPAIMAALTAEASSDEQKPTRREANSSKAANN